MAVELDLELNGCVNNTPVAVLGRALLDPDRIELDLGVDRHPLHWDPVLAALGLLDAALVLAVFDAAPDAVHLRRRTELLDENGREVGHEVLSVEARDGRVRAQYLAATARLEPSERATRVAQVAPAILLPADPRSFLLAGVVGLETDWGGAYRVAALATGTVFGGSAVGPLELELRFGTLSRERAAMSVAVGGVVRELLSMPREESSGRA